MWGAGGIFPLPSRPSHHRLRHILLIRECDGARNGFSWSHGQMARESPAGTRKIPDSAVALERTHVIEDGAWHPERRSR